MSDTIRDGDRCEAVAGRHKGKRGIVSDWHLSKAGHATITVTQDDGSRFKILAKNVSELTD